MECKYICKYCGAKTSTRDEVCPTCKDKMYLLREIRAMLMPYYEIKQEMEREKKDDCR